MEKLLFPGQEEDEKIIILVRHHWMTFLPTLVITFVMLLLPILVVYGIRQIIPSAEDYNNYIILGISAYILFVDTIFFVSWLDYYFDITIITDERLVHIEQRGLFNRQISELNLLRVQNVSTDVKGLIPTFLDYGNLNVETAGQADPREASSDDESNFDMDNLPHPNQLAKTILHLHEALAKGRHPESFAGEGDIRYPKNNEPTPPTAPPVDQPPSQPPSHQPPTEEFSATQPPHKEETPPQSSQFTDKPVIQNQPMINNFTDEGQLKEGETIDL